MNANDVPRMHISEPGDLAQLVPHLIGFQPEESLVIIVLQQGRIEVTARADIADVQQPGRAEELLDRIWNRYPATADAYLMAYTHDQVAGWDLLQRCEDHLPPFADRQTMLVGAETWHTGDGRTGVVDRLGRRSSRGRVPRPTPCSNDEAISTRSSPASKTRPTSAKWRTRRWLLFPNPWTMPP